MIAIEASNFEELADICRSILRQRPPESIRCSWTDIDGSMQVVQNGRMNGKQSWFIQLLAQAEDVRRRRAIWIRRATAA